MKSAKALTESKLPKGAWLFVALLSVVGCLNYLDRTIITTMRVSIIDDMPMTDAQFGLLTSIFLWVYGLLSPIAGYLADKFNRSRVIIISLFVWSAVTWLTSYATTFEQLLATRALMGISEACYIPAALALIADYHRGSSRSLATGIHMAGIMIGQSLGFIGGWIAEEYAWTTSFALLGGIGIVYSAVLLMVLKDAPRQDNEKMLTKDDNGVSFIKGIRGLFSSSRFLILLIYWSLLGIVTWLVVGWLPTYYKENFNLSQALAGLYATGYIYPASLCGVLLGGFLADKWSKKNSRARILVPFIGLCVAAPCIFLASTTSILPLATALFMLWALTKAFCDTNMMPILCMVADVRYRATGYGVINMFSCIVGGLGLYAGGYLRDIDINLSNIYQFAAFTTLISAALLFTVRPRTTDIDDTSNTRPQI